MFIWLQGLSGEIAPISLLICFQYQIVILVYVGYSIFNFFWIGAQSAGDQSILLFNLHQMIMDSLLLCQQGKLTGTGAIGLQQAEVAAMSIILIAG